MAPLVQIVEQRDPAAVGDLIARTAIVQIDADPTVHARSLKRQIKLALRPFRAGFADVGTESLLHPVPEFNGGVRRGIFIDRFR